MNLGLKILRGAFDVLAIFLVPVTFISCKGNTTQYIKKYSVGPVGGSGDFSKLTPNELEIDSILKESPMYRPEYRNNRSRIYLKESENNQDQPMDPVFDKGAGAPCFCSLSKDTIYVNTSLGFFGGYVFELKIYKDEGMFSFMPTLDQRVFKVNLSDSTFQDQIAVPSVIQKMTLEAKPNFSPNEQITGLVEFTTNTYYVKKNEKMVDTVFNSGKVHFTCVLKQGRPFGMPQ